jgi:hypothetical protein
VGPPREPVSKPDGGVESGDFAHDFDHGLPDRDGSGYSRAASPQAAGVYLGLLGSARMSKPHVREARDEGVLSEVQRLLVQARLAEASALREVGRLEDALCAVEAAAQVGPGLARNYLEELRAEVENLNGQHA